MAEPAPHAPLAAPILIADDNLLIRNMLEGSLKAAGYTVVAAENGRQALEIFNKGYYPIVITDWVMPEMTGPELCRAIRADDSGRYTYLIILTSQDSKNDIIAGLDAGADEYLIKPFHQAELLTRLQTAKRILGLESSLKQSMEEIASLSLVDPVTGVFNRRYLEQRLPQELKRAYRYEHSLAVVVIGIGNFRETVESHGYFTGDLLLKGCADCLTESVRKDIDWLARFGEETFVAVLPETDAAGAMILAKRLRIRSAATEIKIYDRGVRLATAFGVASFTASQQRPGMTMEILLDRATGCFHQALKEAGEPIKGVQIS